MLLVSWPNHHFKFLHRYVPVLFLELKRRLNSPKQHERSGDKFASGASLKVTTFSLLA
jgi:hypothetical protein